ncbi:MAG: sulfatase-like hydrolase/transferase [Phycisphaeraceae bacterium]
MVNRLYRLAALALLLASAPALAEDRPNILWLSTEDIGPHIGAYGHPDADTPNLDRFAEQGMSYRFAWSDGPVCAASRTSIIAGMDPNSAGAQHMRSRVRLPDGFHMFPRYLRDAGYYTTNNAKTDYNYEMTGGVWDESSRRAHYRNRAEGQPFFAVFNTAITHESRVFGRFDELEEIPDDIVVPAHHPDLPETRRAWATYNMVISDMDTWIGKMLQELEDEGLREDTIVFFWGDHGAGLPRHKRWPFNSGVHVPLLVYIPEKYQHLAPDDYDAGGMSDRLVAFQDLGPTLLSLAGINPPEHMHGKAYMGKYEDEPRDYLYAFRGRMDERIDMVRAVRDERFIYIRNYMPHRIYGQHLAYMYNNPMTPAWENAYLQGLLAAPDTFYWEQKPVEELYDLQNDYDEVQNLADSAEHQDKLEEFRAVARERALSIRDLGFMPEGMIHRRAGDQPPYVMGHDPEQYPVEEVFDAAERAASRDMADVPQLNDLLSHDDAAVRYWAVTGLTIRGQHAVSPRRHALREIMISDAEDPNVRVAAAEALAFYGSERDIAEALENLVELADLRQHDTFTALASLNVLELLGDRIEPVVDRLLDLPATHPSEPGRSGGYPERALDKIRADFRGDD